MNHRVLIVDDDPAMIRLIQAALRPANLDVVTACDGESALRMLHAELPAILVCDWNMPGLDGVSLCRAIRADQRLKALYVILVTGNARKDQVIAGLTAGADDYLTKPFMREELLARVRTGQRLMAMRDDLARSLHVQGERDHLLGAMRAVDRVLGTVSHELRTPLAAIRMTSEMLLGRDIELPESARSFIEIIDRESTRLAHLVNNMILAVQINTGCARYHWGTVTVREAVAAAVSEAGTLGAGATAPINAVVEPSDLILAGDGAAVRRLLDNLLSNACRHTPGSGRIDVHAMAEHDGHAWVQFTVSDTGGGIQPAVLARLGTAFALGAGQTGDQWVNGSGLGMVICRGVAQAHGGTVSVQSEPGRGTTVSVRLRADLIGPIDSTMAAAA